MIKDSGQRKEFETGAVRDMQEGKGRCDLLPLDVIAELYPERVRFFLCMLNQYIRQGDIISLNTAIEEFTKLTYSDLETAMLEVAIHYEHGATKYKDRNWEAGIPLSSYINSAVRHFFQHMRGDADERHDRAVIWNLLGAIWTHKHKPEMIDLPFKEGVI